MKVIKNIIDDAMEYNSHIQKRSNDRRESTNLEQREEISNLEEKILKMQELKQEGDSNE